MNQPDAAHNRSLRTKINGLTADIDVAVVERLQHLRNGQVIVSQLGLINGDLIVLGLAAPTIDIDHTRYRFKAALQHPILDRF